MDQRIQFIADFLRDAVSITGSEPVERQWAG